MLYANSLKTLIIRLIIPFSQIHALDLGPQLEGNGTMDSITLSSFFHRKFFEIKNQKND